MGGEVRSYGEILLMLLPYMKILLPLSIFNIILLCRVEGKFS